MVIYAKPVVCDRKWCWPCLDNYPSEGEQNIARQAYIDRVDDDEAQAIIMAHVKTIDEAYEYLQKQVSENGDAILKAWRNAKVPRKTNALRRSALYDRKLLEDPWEGLKRHNALSAEGFFSLKTSRTLDQRPDFRSALLLPYLSMKTVREDDTLLLNLLRNRTEFAPSEWATLDLQQTSFARRSGLLERKFNKTCFSIAKDSYGRSQPYSEDRFHKAGDLIGFPNAEILFEAQRNLYSLLRGVVVDLLPKSAGELAGNSKWRADAILMFQNEKSFNTPAEQFPRHEIGIGRAADRHMCSAPLSACSVSELAETFAEHATIRQKDAERELLSLQADPEHVQLRIAQLKRSSHYIAMPEAEQWKYLALDVWAPVCRRIWIWNFVAMWADLWAETSHEQVAGVLQFMMGFILRDEFVPMIADLLVKEGNFDEQLRRLKGSSKTNTSKLKAASTVPISYLSSDPLFWAMAKMSDYELQPEKLPPAEIMEVTAQAIRRDNNQARKLLIDNDALGTVDDLAALSCMCNMMEYHSGIIKLETPELYNNAVATYSPLLRSRKGGQYASSRNGWKDIFDPDAFATLRIDKAGTLLKEFCALRPPKWSDKDLVAQLEKNRALRIKLDTFWKEMSEQRVAFLTAKNSLSPDEIDILPDVMQMRQGYEDESDLRSMEAGIATARAQAMAAPVQKNKTRASVVAGTYVPLPATTAPPRDRTVEAAMSKRMERIAEREARDEKARILAGALPTPPVPTLTPPAQIPLKQKYLDVVAWFWPHDSGVVGSSLRISTGDCVEALGQANMRQPATSSGGSHVPFTGPSGKLIFPQIHKTHSARMDRRRLAMLGRACTSSLGWTWATFDPQAVIPVPVAGDGEDDGDDAGEGGDRGAGDAGRRAGNREVGNAGRGDVGGGDGAGAGANVGAGERLDDRPADGGSDPESDQETREPVVKRARLR